MQMKFFNQVVKFHNVVDGHRIAAKHNKHDIFLRYRNTGISSKTEQNFTSNKLMLKWIGSLIDEIASDIFHVLNLF